MSTRQAAEADLAGKAAQYRPDELARYVTGWTSTGRTDITELTLACGPDNRLAEKGWTTRKNTHGHTEWLPPPHLDHGQPRTNTFHHPERFLHNQDDDDKPD